MPFEGTNTLIVFDDCDSFKRGDRADRWACQARLFRSTHRHQRVSADPAALQHHSKPLQENVATIVLFYTPSAKITKAIFEEYAGELTKNDLKVLISKLKELCIRFPFGIELILNGKITMYIRNG